MTITLKQGDTAPIIERTLYLSGSPQNITGYQSVTFRMFDEYENLVIEDDTTGNVSVDDASDGLVSYKWKMNDTNTIGRYEAEFEVVYSDGSTITYPNDGFIPVVIHE